MDDGPLIQMELLKQTGQKTVPNTFIGGRHIGGNSELQELHAQDEAEEMILNAAAVSA